MKKKPRFAKEPKYSRTNAPHELRPADWQRAVSRVQLPRILKGRSSMSADMAIRIGLLTDTTPESWLAGQSKWDLWQASQKGRPSVTPRGNVGESSRDYAELHSIETG